MLLGVLTSLTKGNCTFLKVPIADHRCRCRTDGQSMGEKLRAAATEMNYYADILQDVRSDRFKVLDEMSGKLTEGFNKLDGASESKSHEH